MGRLKRAAELREEQPRLQLRLIKAVRKPLPGADPARFHNHLFVEVKQPEGGPAIQGMKAMQFHIFEDGSAILDYSVQERTSYIKPGTYDLYFTSKESGDPHQQLAILTENAFGELDITSTPEPQPKDDTPAETEKTWDAFGQFSR
jgi:hypothetical protein